MNPDPETEPEEPEEPAWIAESYKAIYEMRPDISKLPMDDNDIRFGIILLRDADILVIEELMDATT